MRRVGVNRHVVVATGSDWQIADDDTGINCDRAVFIHDQRIDIHGADPWQLANHRRNSEQDGFERFHADLRHVAALAEFGAAADRCQHVSDQHRIERRQGDRAFRTGGFDAGTAGTENDGRAEDFVADHAHDQFAAVSLLDHRFDGDAVDLGVRPVALDFFGDFEPSVAHGGEAVQIEANATGIGLVHDVRRIDLHHYRQAEFFSQHHGLGSRAGDDRLRNRNTEGRQHGFRFHFVERLAAFHQRGFDHQTGGFQARWCLVGNGCRRLHQQLAVQVILGNVRKQVDCGFRRIERGNAGTLEQQACFADLCFAHPCGKQRLLRLLGNLDHGARGLCRVGHRLRRQDGQHAVDVFVIQAGLQGGAVTGRVGVADNVDRIGFGPVGGKEFAKPGHGCRAQFSHRDADVLGMVCRHDAGATAIGNDGQPFAAGMKVGKQGRGRSVHLTDAVQADDAGTAQGGIENVVHSDQRTGV